MSAQTLFATVDTQVDLERRHRVHLALAYAAAVIIVCAIALYGFEYYSLDALQRPYSGKHRILRPSGYIGIKLGILGAVMFAVIFLYPIRKRWKWLQGKGSSRHWLDFHVVLGLFAPIVIALHSSFKFQGIAGMAFWLMLSVAVSGIVGRYLYAQIPRRVNSAELSMRESRDIQKKLFEELAQQKVVSAAMLQPLFRLPTEDQVQRWAMLVCFAYMVVLDVLRPFRVAKLRLRFLSFSEKLTSVGGLLSTNHKSLEAVIRISREQASLSKKIVFLSRAQQVFHLWHVVHKPFSYSFVVLTVLHIVVVMWFGFV